MHSLLKNNLSRLHQVFEEHRVLKAYAFGSICSDKFNDQSDIDVLVYMDESLDPVTYGEHYFELADELEKIFLRPVDLLTSKSLKNPYFIKSVEKSRISLYE